MNEYGARLEAWSARSADRPRRFQLITLAFTPWTDPNAPYLRTISVDKPRLRVCIERTPDV